MNNKLNGLKVAILVADGFEQSEMTEPKKALEEAGAKTTIVSPSKGKVKAWQHKSWGDEKRLFRMKILLQAESLKISLLSTAQ